MRIDIRRKNSLKKGDEVYGAETRIKVVKNKVAPPFKETTVDMLYGEGISYEGELIDVGTELDILEKSGSWYSFDGKRIGQGRETVRDFLKQNPDIARDIENKIRSMKGLKPRATSLTPGVAAPLPEPEPKKPAKKSAPAQSDDVFDDAVIEPDEIFE